MIGPVKIHWEDRALDIYEELSLHDCPYCGGPAVLEEEGGWCWYVMCADCGSQTAHFEYSGVADRADAARKAAHLWNIGKVVRVDISE